MQAALKTMTLLGTDKTKAAKYMTTLGLAAGAAVIAGKIFSGNSEPLEDAESIHEFPIILNKMRIIEKHRASHEKAYVDARDALDKFLTMYLGCRGSDDTTATDVSQMAALNLDFEKYTLYLCSCMDAKPAAEVFDAYGTIMDVCTELAADVVKEVRDNAGINWRIKNV